MWEDIDEAKIRSFFRHYDDIIDLADRTAEKIHKEKFGRIIHFEIYDDDCATITYGPWHDEFPQTSVTVTIEEMMEYLKDVKT